MVIRFLYKHAIRLTFIIIAIIIVHIIVLEQYMNRKNRQNVNVIQESNRASHVSNEIRHVANDFDFNPLINDGGIGSDGGLSKYPLMKEDMDFDSNDEFDNNNAHNSSPVQGGAAIYVSFVVCGEHHFQRAYTLMKSAIIFTRQTTQLRFLIVADEDNVHRFQSKVTVGLFFGVTHSLQSHLLFFTLALNLLQVSNEWPQALKDRVTVEFHNVTIPQMKKDNQKEWLQLFKPCASERLFLPVSMRCRLFDFRSLIYHS